MLKRNTHNTHFLWTNSKYWHVSRLRYEHECTRLTVWSANLTCGTYIVSINTRPGSETNSWMGPSNQNTTWTGPVWTFMVITHSERSSESVLKSISGGFRPDPCGRSWSISEWVWTRSQTQLESNSDIHDDDEDEEQAAGMCIITSSTVWPLTFKAITCKLSQKVKLFELQFITSSAGGVVSTGTDVHQDRCPWGQMSTGTDDHRDRCPWGQSTLRFDPFLGLQL